MAGTFYDDDALKAGERLFNTVEHGDLEDLWTIFGEGAMVWHNTDEKLTDVATSIQNLRKIRESATEFRYVDVKRLPTPNGFVQQHTLLITMPDGRKIRDVCCCVCDVKDGRITHIDAYHDSAVTGAMAHKSGAA
jgi:ketosteroid isomerase-like protein